MKKGKIKIILEDHWHGFLKIYENKTFKLNNVLKYELHSADENVKA